MIVHFTRFGASIAPSCADMDGYLRTSVDDVRKGSYDAGTERSLTIDEMRAIARECRSWVAEQDRAISDWREGQSS